MKRAVAALLLVPPLAPSAPAQPTAQPLEEALQEAQVEQRSAAAEAQRLEQAAAAAKTKAERLQAQQAAAAQGLEAAEARITAADAEYRLAAAHAAAFRAQLNEEQRPVSSLLAGLATMARRPPLLALADRGSVDDLVEVSVLLDSTLPVIRARTRALSAQLARGEQLQAGALAAKSELLHSRQALVQQQSRFADLQRQAIAEAMASGGEALRVGDVAIAANEQVQQIRGAEARAMSANEIARLLAAQQPAPPRPGPAGAAAIKAPFAYALPVSAPVLQGLGAVDDSGVRSRGITFGTPRGTKVSAPAAGVIRYSGPFRDFDGIVIIDHGHGWLSVIVNVASPLKTGDTVQLGQPLGRALGPVQVQLLDDGALLSPALIAGSSPSLSNEGKAS